MAQKKFKRADYMQRNFPFANSKMPFSLEILHAAYGGNLYFNYLSDYMFKLGDDEWLYNLWTENTEIYDQFIIIGHMCLVKSAEKRVAFFSQADAFLRLAQG
jgi:hypothetical protein